MGKKEIKTLSWAGRALLFGLIAYALVLTFFTFDNALELGVVRPKLDRRIIRQINALGDPNLTQEQRRGVMEDIISFHEFSAPLLLDAIEKGDPAVQRYALLCLQEIAARFYNQDIRPAGDDIDELRRWWNEMRQWLDG